MAKARPGGSGRHPSIMVFDGDETLLDPEFIIPPFERAFRDRRIPREWFNPPILHSNLITRVKGGAHAPQRQFSICFASLEKPTAGYTTKSDLPSFRAFKFFAEQSGGYQSAIPEPRFQKKIQISRNKRF